MQSKKRQAKPLTFTKRRSAAFQADPVQSRSIVRNTSVAPRTKSLKMGWFKSHTGGFPQRYRETLRWVLAGTAITSIGGSAFSTIQAPILNTAYQPVAGTTFAGFAKLMAVYTKAFVVASKVTASLSNYSTAVAQSPVTYGITLATTGAGTFTTMGAAVQGGLCVYKQVGDSPDTCVLTQSVDCNKFFGVDDITDTTEYRTLVTTNPTQEVFANIWVQNMSATPTDFVYSVVVDADVIFTDPIPIT